MSVSTSLVFACRVAISLAGLYWFMKSDQIQLGIAIVALTLTALPGRFIRDRPLRSVTTAVVAVLLAAHIVLGMLGALYETSILYDKIMHALGSGAVTGLLMMAVHRYCDRHLIELPLVLFVALVLGGTLSAGTLWELFEFAIDRTGMFNAQRGLNDTMLDLLANASGIFMMLAAASLAGCKFEHRAISE